VEATAAGASEALG
jgi:transposase-like protein